MKVPDYEYFLAAYRNEDWSFMLGKGVESVMWTWERYGVQKHPLQMLSMMFCGYWNKAYGDHFVGPVNFENIKSYHGPAKLSLQHLENLLMTDQPSLIIRKLREVALEDPAFKSFNHQSAWSRQDMISIARRHGFDIHTTDTHTVLQTYSELIPDIQNMHDFSMYLEFVKNASI